MTQPDRQVSGHMSAVKWMVMHICVDGHAYMCMAAVIRRQTGGDGLMVQVKEGKASGKAGRGWLARKTASPTPGCVLRHRSHQWIRESPPMQYIWNV